MILKDSDIDLKGCYELSDQIATLVNNQYMIIENNWNDLDFITKLINDTFTLSLALKNLLNEGKQNI